MLTAFGWVLFGMAVWGLCIVMQALERRFSPEGGMMESMFDDGTRRRRQPPRPPVGFDPKDREIAELKRRVETLEAIVTDRRYQWEQEYRNAP